MARRLDKSKAIELRLRGFSYSQIKKLLRVGKGTLSAWLKNYPLTEERIKELRGNNEVRIEKCRNTKAKKKQKRLEMVFLRFKKEFGVLSKRDLFIGGLFLYWGEGTKASSNSITLTNTDPCMIIFYLSWLKILKIDKNKLRVKLHLYSDMDEKSSKEYWSELLGIPLANFSKCYIKQSKLKNLSYKNGFGHGTCSIRLSDVHLAEYIKMGLKYIREYSGRFKK